MRAYYGSRFSKNMTATPEGFLIAHNVPIARTGWYEYLAEELGIEGRPGETIKVYRSPDEVFSDAAMASFEGKPVTDEHPPGHVTPDNAAIYTKGHVQNVRRGSGDDSDLLLADLVIIDQQLIREIQDGKREVSCGYGCEYEQDDDGTYRQVNICGNHVAVVKAGRAGDRVAIKDQKPKGEIKMSKIKGKKPGGMLAFLAALGLKQFAADAEPEELQAALDAMSAGSADEGAEEKESKDADHTLEALSAKVDQLAAAVAKLVEAKEPSPEDAIDEAIAKLEAGKDDEEESHTIPAENMDEGGPVQPAEQRPKDPITGQVTGDNAYKIAALRAIKPVIAAISDAGERKKAADAAIAAVQGSKPVSNTYGKINPRKPTQDEATSVADYTQLGREIAKKHNPHYKNRD